MAPAKRSKIIVFDDEPGILEIIASFLEKDYEVTTFEDAALGIDLIEGGECDLIISDISMPNMSGIGLLDRMERVGTNIPLIFVTGRGDDEIIESLRHTVVASLRKPFSEQDLVEAVKSALQK